MKIMQTLNTGELNITITGIEVMHMFKKGQFNFWLRTKPKTEADFVKELFEVYA